MKINFTKLWSCSIFMILVFSFCSLANAASVLVYIGGGGESVYVKKQGDAEVIGENTSSFTISATFDSKSLETTEVKPVDPVWSCTYQGATFVPPSGVEPVPEEPSKPNVSALTRISSYSDDNSSWTTKVSSPNAGQWILKFKVTVKYSKQSKTTGQNIPNEFFGPFEGENTFSFIAINKTWKVKLTPEDDVVCRHSTKPARRPVLIVKASLENADDAKSVTISSSNKGGIVKFGTVANNVTDTNINLTIPKTGTTSFYISGEKESTKTNDVIITATSDDNPPEIVSSKNCTVLWVNISLRTTGKVSDDNSARNLFTNLGSGPSKERDKYNLGERIMRDPEEGGDLYGYAFEIKGVVSPKDFPYNVSIDRDVECFHNLDKFVSWGWVQRIPLTIDATTAKLRQRHRWKSFTTEVPGDVIKNGQYVPMNDTGPDGISDKKAPNIYDLDWPSYPILKNNDRCLYIRLDNFRQFSTYSMERCSDVLEFSHKHFHFKEKGQTGSCIKSLKSEIKEEPRVIPKSVD
jgi:hypothetical protein